MAELGEAYDFKGLAEILSARAEELVEAWAPGGRARGREYVAGSIVGGPGESFSFNTQTCKWADFATQQKGGDLISLYAAQNNLDQGEAYRRLNEAYGVTNVLPIRRSPKPQEVDPLIPTKPPHDVALPDCVHYIYGTPSGKWVYRDLHNHPLHLVARYDTEGGKQVIPWSYVAGRWVMKAWKAPRPIYGLAALHDFPSLPVLIVEGEKAADAAQRIVGDRYVVVTWSGGCQAFTKADFEPLYGRNILIWPDADQPGIKAMRDLGESLLPHVKTVKILDVSDISPHGFDAADFKGAWEDFLAWGKQRARVIQDEQVQEVLAPEEPPMPDDQDLPHDVDTATPAPETASAIKSLGLLTTVKGSPYPAELNVLKILAGVPQFADSMWYDEFHHKIFTTLAKGHDRSSKPREWEDSDSRRLLLFLQQEFSLHTIKMPTVERAVLSYAETRVRNEPKDWLETIQWDGQERIDTFFSHYMGAKFANYAIYAARNFWISVVARIYRPGCKVDNMVVLVGAQGTFKSSALALIGGKWFAEVHQSVQTNDFKLALQGKLIIEISELGSFSVAEDAPIKSAITCQVDRFRVPYGHHMADYPRQCVFAGTTNNQDFQRDSTGGRRFMAITVGRIDLDAIKNDRDQLFAEAKARYKKGESWHVMPADESRENYEKHIMEDSWQPIIEDWAAGRESVTLREILIDCLKFDINKIENRNEKRAAKCLRLAGYERNVERVGKSVRRRWKRIDENCYPLPLITPEK